MDGGDCRTAPATPGLLSYWLLVSMLADNIHFKILRVDTTLSKSFLSPGTCNNGIGLKQLWRILGGYLRESVKKTHWICGHDHTSPEPTPSFLFKLWSVLFFALFFFNNWVISYVLKLILVMFQTNFGYV